MSVSETPKPKAPAPIGRGMRWFLLARLTGSPERMLTILAIVIGAITGLGAIVFSKLIEYANLIFFVHAGTTLQQWGLYLWLLPLLPMIGGLLVGTITTFFAPEAEGHGVPEVMDAMARKGCRIRPRVAGAKAVASALTIGSGGSAGTEGPIIQIGAALGSGLGQWLRLNVGDMKVLIGCGAAAGIAAIFNAPIAGVLFAIEVLLRDVSLRSFLPIIISSVASTTVTQAVLGHKDPIFPIPLELLDATPIYRFSVVEVGNYAVLGVLCGLVAFLFVKALYFSEDVFRKMPGHRILRPVLGGLLLGLAAVGTSQIAKNPHLQRGTSQPTTQQDTAHAKQPAIMGNGYPVIGMSLEQHAYPPSDAATGPNWTIRVFLILLAAKILATCLTLGSGGSGGVFAPSLFIGAMTGGAFGLFVQQTGWFPEVTPGAYALVGMAAVVAASIHAPLTATLMLFELTGDYEVIVPIMLSGVIGLFVAQRLEPASIYTLKLLRRGVDMFKGQDISVLRGLPVRSEMRPDPVTVTPGSGLMEVVAQFVEHPGSTIFVVDEDRCLRGLITDAASRAVMSDAAMFKDFIIAQDIMEEQGFPAASPDDSLADIMTRLARYRGEVPVVENGRLVGAIWPEDVIERYNAEVLKRDMATSMASNVARVRTAQPVPALENTSLMEVPVPRMFVGQSLGSLDFRKRYGVTVLMIKQQDGAGAEEVNAVPSAGYVFRPNDVLLLMGPDDRLRALSRGDV